MKPANTRYENKMKIVRPYTGSDQKSHFEEIEFQLAARTGVET